MKRTAWIWSAVLSLAVALAAPAGAQERRRGAPSRATATQEHRGALTQRKATAAAPKRAAEPVRKDKGRTLGAQRGNSPAPRRR